MPRNLVKDPVRYKTVLCQKWEATGACPYGHKCQFAHGAKDLRERVDKSKEKELKSKSKEQKHSGEQKESLAQTFDQPAPLQPPPAILVDAPLRASSPERLSPTGQGHGPSAAAASTSSRASSSSSPPPPPPVAPQLPPGLGLTRSTRKHVRWAPGPAQTFPSSPSGSLPSPSSSSVPPSPSTPPALASRPSKSLAVENEPPQTAGVVAPLCYSCEPPQSDCGMPTVSINSKTGKIELTSVSRQPSYTTDSVRRSLSFVFADAELDEVAPAPTSNVVWQHDHFGIPAQSTSSLPRMPVELHGWLA